MPRPITVTDLTPVGAGIERPEQVLVADDGRVYASDKASAVAEVLADGTLRRMGRAGGEPNGIGMDSAGRFLIANFGLGRLQRLDPRTGSIDVLLADSVDGYPLTWLNYVLVDSSDAIWASVCTTNPDLRATLAHGTRDGFLVRVEPDGSHARVVADGIDFPNCMALDRQERRLYVVRTTAADVVRFEIAGPSLGDEVAYCPPVGKGMADGCAFDADGNLWVTLVTTDDIVAVTPDRELVPVSCDPGGLVRNPTSIAWGGEDLQDVYIGSLATPHVLKGRSSVAGMPMVHQRRRR